MRDQGRRGVDVDPSRQLGHAVDRGRDDRGEVNDRGGRDVGHQALNLVGIGEVGPPELDSAGQLLGRLDGWRACRGRRDDAAAVGRQAAAQSPTRPGRSRR